MRGATPGSSSAQVQAPPEELQPSPTSQGSGTFAEEVDEEELASSCLRPPGGGWQRICWLFCLPWSGPRAATTYSHSAHVRRDDSLWHGLRNLSYKYLFQSDEQKAMVVCGGGAAGDVLETSWAYVGLLMHELQQDE